MVWDNAFVLVRHHRRLALLPPIQQSKQNFLGFLNGCWDGNVLGHSNQTCKGCLREEGGWWSHLGGRLRGERGWWSHLGGRLGGEVGARSGVGVGVGGSCIVLASSDYQIRNVLANRRTTV